MQIRSIVIVFLLLPLSACKSKNEIFISSNGAVNGYDVVAYFTEGKPVKGTDSIHHHWNNADWYFSSEKNLDLFKKDPEKYMPQYGGYCAFGTAEGHKAPTDPHAWTIVNDKLYLNYNQDVRKDWLGNQRQFIEQADKNWPQVKEQKF